MLQTFRLKDASYEVPQKKAKKVPKIKVMGKTMQVLKLAVFGPCVPARTCKMETASSVNRRG